MAFISPEPEHIAEGVVDAEKSLHKKLLLVPVKKKGMKKKKVEESHLEYNEGEVAESVDARVLVNKKKK